MAFYLIKNEEQIDEILKDNILRLVVILYSSQNEKIFDKETITKTKQVKKYFNNLKDEYPNIIFLYVNLNNYGYKKNTYTNDITKNVVPRVSFYYNLSRLANIDSLDAMGDIKDVIEKLNDKFINNKKSNIQIQENIEEGIPEQAVEKQPTEDEVEKQLDVQRKLEEIERLKQQYLILELQKIKKMKEEQEGFQTSDTDSDE